MGEGPGGQRKVAVVPTGNEELDRKLPGGLPTPSLVLIEGDHGSGKSVVVWQFVYGMLKVGLRVVVFTTETTVKDYLAKMASVSMDPTEYFIRGQLSVYSTQIPRASWSMSNVGRLLPALGEWALKQADKFDALAVDSLSHLAVYATPSKVMDFFNKARLLTDRGKTVLLTLHAGALREDLATRARALCDGYIRLKVASVGGRTVKVMEIVKLNGAPRAFDSTITFDVDPAFGIKVVPISLAKA